MANRDGGRGFLDDGDGPPKAVRIAWLIAVGWWLAAITILFAGLLCITIVGIPPGYWLLRRVLNVATLKHSVPGRPWWQLARREPPSD